MKKRFAFASDAAEREYKELPANIQKDFGTSLSAIQSGNKPFLSIEALTDIAPGVIELKVNGSPAFRCVYTTKFLDTVFVLHSFRKTTNGVDRQAMKTLKQRHKELVDELSRIEDDSD